MAPLLAPYRRVVKPLLRLPHHMYKSRRINTRPLVVAQRLGHSDPGFTMRVYGHVAEGLQRDAAKEFEKMMAGDSG